MSVKKTIKRKSSGITKKTTTTQKSSPVSMVTWEHAVKKIFITLFAILLVYLTVWVGAEIRNSFKEYNYIGLSDRVERTIIVDAEGKVTATPDVAKTTLGLITEGETVADAQQSNSQTIAEILTRLESLGIEKKDIKTANYSIYPNYDYTDDGREFNGYTVSQQIAVTIRDLDKANAIVGLAGELGLNSVGGLQFAIDDPEKFVEEAREEALEKAFEKAASLSQSLGVRFVAIMNYEEFSGGADVLALRSLEEGIGGDSEPTLESGSLDVSMQVRITFEIR